MSSISFTNPYLLIVGGILLALVVIAFFLSIKKSGFNFHNIAALVIHVLIVILVSNAIAQLTIRTVQTKTTVYVLADVSYSSNNNLDKIDEYISTLDKNLPKNSDIGIICYGRDFELLVEPGAKIKSVKESNVDTSATSLKPALEYASSSFSDDVIKRIVIISDGNETNDEKISSLVKDYEARDIHIDAIYLDNNISSDIDEIQISNVNSPSSSYINNSADALISIESNKQASCDLVLYEVVGDSEVEVNSSKDLLLSKGINSVSISLDTSVGGNHYYRLALENMEDTNDFNNSYYFSHMVNETLNVLYIGTSQSDYETYASNNKTATIVPFINDKNVPYTIEDLCMFDEIVLSNVNISDLNYSNMFITNLELAVSLYGKSLVTIGNTYIQNNTNNENESLKVLGQMLPVKYDLSNDTNRVYTIVIDISKSMDSLSHLIIAKKAAYSIIDNLEETDTLFVVAFYGDVIAPVNFEKATPMVKEKAKKTIEDLESLQATSLGAALEYTYENLVNKNYANKQIMLISDGLSYGPDQTNIDSAAQKIGKTMHISTIFTAKNSGEISTNLNNIAKYGNGKAYSVASEEEAERLFVTTIQDDVKESYKSDKNGYSLAIKKPKDDLVKGITSLNKVYDFYVSRKKTTAQNIIEVDEKGQKYPLYSDWSYGEGTVSSITTSFKNLDTSLVERISIVNKPSVFNDSPLLVNSLISGETVNVTLTPPEVNSLAVASVRITYPSADKQESVEEIMSFNSEYYLASFKISESGWYRFDITYTIGSNQMSISKEFSLSYLSEYDSFEMFDSSNLYNYITSDGQVSENGQLKISNDGLPVTYYKYELAPAFLIISCVLFVAEIAIRKLRWQDVKDLFKKRRAQ